MRAGIMQPYFFPYMGYWNLVAAVDQWYFFDLPRFARKSWINRNRVLHFDDDKEFSYITVPALRQQTGIAIKDVRVNNDQPWRDDIRGKLTTYGGRNAPYYRTVLDLVDSVLEIESEYLVDYIAGSFGAVREYVGLRVDHSFLSRTAYRPEETLGAGDWARSVVNQLGGDTYVNPAGGVGLFDPAAYANDGIELRFVRPRLSPYPQARRGGFVPGLSIVDALMFLPPEEILDRITTDYDLLTHEEAVEWTRTS